MSPNGKKQYEIHLVRRTASAEFGDTTYHPGGTFGPRLQSGYQLVVLLSGSLVVTVDSTPMVVPTNHVVCLAPGHREFFSFARDQISRHLWVTMDPEGQGFPAEWSVRCPMGPAPASTRLQTLLQLGLERGRSVGRSEPEVLRCLARACFFEFVSDIEHLDRNPEFRSPAVEKALAFLSDHFRDITSLSEIAAAAAVTPQHLIKLFKIHCSETPMACLWKLRTDEGVKLLAHTGLTISEIADRVGFQSPYHFSKRVYARHGTYPRALRQQLWTRHGNQTSDKSLDDDPVRA